MRSKKTFGAQIVLWIGLFQGDREDGSYWTRFWSCSGFLLLVHFLLSLPPVFPAKSMYVIILIVQGWSCRPVARRGKSFTTLETLIAHWQIRPWWSWWTGTWCCICICCICIFSFLRRHQKWHAWNGALPTKTSLQLALDPLIFFTQICQVSDIGIRWSLYIWSIFSSGQWTFFSRQGALVFYTLKNPGWPEMNLSLPSSPFCLKGVVILLLLEAVLTIFINCQLQLDGFPNLEVSHWLNGIVIANPNKT